MLVFVLEMYTLKSYTVTNSSFFLTIFLCIQTFYKTFIGPFKELLDARMIHMPGMRIMCSTMLFTIKLFDFLHTE